MLADLGAMTVSDGQNVRKKHFEADNGEKDRSGEEELAFRVIQQAIFDYVSTRAHYDAPRRTYKNPSTNDNTGINGGWPDDVLIAYQIETEDYLLGECEDWEYNPFEICCEPYFTNDMLEVAYATFSKHGWTPIERGMQRCGVSLFRRAP